MRDALLGEVLWFLLLVTVNQELSDGLESASSLARFSPLALAVQLIGGKVVGLEGGCTYLGRRRSSAY